MAHHSSRYTRLREDTLMDLTTLTDEEFDEYRQAVLAEGERRTRLATAPDQVAAIASRFVADGGDPAVMVQAVSPTPTEPAE